MRFKTADVANAGSCDDRTLEMGDVANLVCRLDRRQMASSGLKPAATARRVLKGLEVSATHVIVSAAEMRRVMAATLSSH